MAASPNWHDAFITLNDSGQFIVWNETQSDQIGQFDRYLDAVEYLNAYAATLENNLD
jgi:hypothetical protein